MPGAPRVASAWLSKPLRAKLHICTRATVFRPRLLSRFNVQRLKSRTQFQAVLAGATIARTVHFVLHRAPVDTQVAGPIGNRAQAAQQASLFPLAAVWLGAMVPKRWARRAVTRNTIKRQIYSVSTDIESTLAVAAHVVRLRAAFDRRQFVSATSEALKTAIRHELQQLFSSLPPAPPACAGRAGVA